MLTPSLLILFSLVATVLLTDVLRRYALSRSLFDIPNARSSHDVPTPRGGGMALVTVAVIALGVLVGLREISPEVLMALGGAGLIVAVVGFLDDHAHIPIRLRLLQHFLAAVWGLYWLGGLPAVTIWTGSVDFGWFGHIVATLSLVWLLNLYNFMDGINGIAGIELVTVAFCGIVLSVWVGTPAHGLFFASLMASGIGFLVWNFPTARIFMGDACSGYLGVTLGLIAVWQGSVAPTLFAAWILLLGVFVIDATLTLIRRIIRGERFYEAHRTHAYQVASRYYGSHVPVTLGVGGINLVWLLPWSVAVATGVIPAVAGLFLAWLPLVALTLWFRAGKGENGLQ